VSRIRSHYWTGFIVLYALVQVVVPAIMLREPRPARFGWHMFTQGRAAGQFTVIHAGGRRTRVRIRDYTIMDRQEVAFHAVLPAHLCRVIPDAHAVEVKGATGMGAPETVVQCR
jgi:hypothetical protein